MSDSTDKKFRIAELVVKLFIGLSISYSLYNINTKLDDFFTGDGIFVTQTRRQL